MKSKPPTDREIIETWERLNRSVRATAKAYEEFGIGAKGITSLLRNAGRETRPPLYDPGSRPTVKEDHEQVARDIRRYYLGPLARGLKSEKSLMQIGREHKGKIAWKTLLKLKNREKKAMALERGVEPDSIHEPWKIAPQEEALVRSLLVAKKDSTRPSRRSIREISLEVGVADKAVMRVEEQIVREMAARGIKFPTRAQRYKNRLKRARQRRAKLAHESMSGISRTELARKHGVTVTLVKNARMEAIAAGRIPRRRYKRHDEKRRAFETVGQMIEENPGAKLDHRTIAERANVPIHVSSSVLAKFRQMAQEIKNGERSVNHIHRLYSRAFGVSEDAIENTSRSLLRAFERGNRSLKPNKKRVRGGARRRR
ncbi:MAG: hypothetical protein JXB14_02940 [Candidatus Altiarchaeota archaeon]|nr:hypothetical protein [Candidatus Altiarchaeota archaeon]